MDIKLYYVEGISKEDTPYFSTIGEQEQYFEDREVISIKDTWYPPYYKNKIKLEVTDELNVNTRVNYLSFDYQGKEYYYFITAVHYHSEEVFSVDIEMDTIQTFMFNFELTSAIIERQHINRWKTVGYGNIINRDYLRENVSAGNHILKDKGFVESDPSQRYDINHKADVRGWVVMNFTNRKGFMHGYVGETVYSGHLAQLINDTLFPSVEYSVLVPIFVTNYEYPLYNNVYYVGEGENQEPFANFNTIQTYMGADDSTLVDGHFIPFTPFANMQYKTEREQGSTLDKLVIILEEPFRAGKEGGEITSPGGIYTNGALTIDPVRVTTPFAQLINFSKNTSKTSLFDSSYEPALLDENYVRLYFGENGAMATFPLYQATYPSFVGYYYADLLTGDRYYNLLPDNVDYSDLQDKYNTLVRATAPLYLDAVNDTWKTWKAQNKGTMLIAGVDTVIQGAKGFIDGYSSGKGVGMSVAQAGFNMWDASKGVIRREINSVFAPDSLKSTASWSSDTLGHKGVIQYSKWEVDDIEQVAHYYQRYGNLVNKYIDTTVSLFADVNTRYYFNYVKMSDCVVHLIHYIEADDITESIKDRLTSGIRLWNVDKTSIGNYTYDNVEKAFIQ